MITDFLFRKKREMSHCTSNQVCNSSGVIDSVRLTGMQLINNQVPRVSRASVN